MIGTFVLILTIITAQGHVEITTVEGFETELSCHMSGTAWERITGSRYENIAANPHITFTCIKKR